MHGDEALPLDAERPLELTTRDSAQTDQLARNGPSVAGAQGCFVAWLGLRFPQRPPLSIPRLLVLLAKDGEVAHSFQPLLGVSRSFFSGLIEPSGRSHDRGRWSYLLLL